MQATESKPATTAGPIPRWVAWVLIVGAVLLLGWAWFIAGFLSEPSAVGRSRLALDWFIGSAAGGAIAGLVSAAGILRSQPWARRAGIFASIVLILSCAGVVVAAPALAGLWPTRRSS